MRSTDNNNLVYGCYSNGIYVVEGNETGHPCTGYGGFMISFHGTQSRYVYVKLLVLMNSYIYVMSQNNSGKVLVPFKLVAKGSE